MDNIFENKNPLSLFNRWLEEAEKQEINDPGAMALATCNKDGKPSVRMVLLKGADERGFKFHTNADSQKGLEMAENDKVALCFHWKSLRKQVRVEGTVHEISNEEADEYFATRPYNRQIGAWASQQSRPLENRETLEKDITKYEQEFQGQDIPPPALLEGVYRETANNRILVGQSRPPA